jgi:hypothetical protein
MGLKLHPEPAGTPELDQTSAIEVSAPPATPAAEPAPAVPVKVDWGAGEVSEADQQVRAEVETTFGVIGLNKREADRVIALARVAAQTDLSDEDYAARAEDTKATLHAEWGSAFKDKLAGSYHLARQLEERLGAVVDFEAAINGGLLVNAEVRRILATAAERRHVGDDVAALDRLWHEANTVNEGSPRHREIKREREMRGKRLWGSAS